MSKATWFCLICAVGVALTAFTSHLVADTKEKADEKVEADFSGKVLYISTKDPTKGAILEGVKVRQLGSRSFLFGKIISADKKSVFSKTPMWFAVDDVVEIFEFNTVEDARKAKEELEQK